MPTVSFAVDRQNNRKSLPPLSINTTQNGAQQLMLHESPARRPVSQRGILRSSVTTKNNSDPMITSMTMGDISIMTQSSYESTTACVGENPDTETFGNLYASRRLSTYGTVYDGLSTTRKLSKENTNDQWRRTLTEHNKRDSADECRCPTDRENSSK